MPDENKTETCVIDCRVSDPQQLKGGSLEDQETLGRRFAQSRGWKVLKVFRKPQQGSVVIRDDIEEIKKFIKTSPEKVNNYIFKCTDRFTRAGYIEYSLIKEAFEKLGVSVWDTYGIIQQKQNTLQHLGGFEYKWSVYAPSEAAEMLSAHHAKQEWRDIINRLIGAEIRLVQSGYSVRRAPDGLKNETVMVGTKEYTVRKEDPERVRFFKAMFDLRAEGLDDVEIVARINAMGFLTQEFRHWDRTDRENPVVVGKRGGKPLTVKQFQRFIQCTEYAGVTCEKWTHNKPVKMAHFNGIVSISRWNDANRGKKYIKENQDGTLEVIYDYQKFVLGKPKRLRNNPDYRYKFFPCHICGNPMIGSAPRSKSGKPSPRYHCGGVVARKHPYYSIPRDAYEKAVKKFVDALKFSDAMIATFERVLNEMVSRHQVIA
jgi:hypothetical protein